MVGLTDHKKALSLTLPASLTEIDNVLHQTMDFFREQAFKGDLFTYSYIIREALNNAVIHGSRNDAAKTIILDLTLSPEGVDIRIEDEGNGFDWQTLLRRNLVPSKATSGRGIFSMSRLHFKTSYNPKGNILYLHKDLRQTLKKEQNYESH